jgi:dolichol-phosphate mannosyltransferase
LLYPVKVNFCIDYNMLPFFIKLMETSTFYNLEGPMKVTVIILAKDEEATIERVVKGALAHADRVLVVDGHSIDATRQKAVHAGAEVALDNRLGKGDGYKVGMKEAGTEGVLVFMDADASHDPADIPKLVEPIINNRADMVIASRWKAGSDDVDASFSSFIRNVGGNLLTVLINLRFGAQITDALNGFRSMRAELASQLKLVANDFDIEHEMIMKALKKGWRIAEAPSHEYARAGGRSKLPTYSKFYLFFWRFIRNLL